VIVPSVSQLLHRQGSELLQEPETISLTPSLYEAAVSEL
jgi:hypothetical protein